MFFLPVLFLCLDMFLSLYFVCIIFFKYYSCVEFGSVGRSVVHSFIFIAFILQRDLYMLFLLYENTAKKMHCEMVNPKHFFFARWSFVSHFGVFYARFMHIYSFQFISCMLFSRYLYSSILFLRCQRPHRLFRLHSMKIDRANADVIKIFSCFSFLCLFLAFAADREKYNPNKLLFAIAINERTVNELEPFTVDREKCVIFI